MDPELSSFAGPFFRAWLILLKGADAYKPEDMPPIDVLIVSHDHYDRPGLRHRLGNWRKRLRKVVVPMEVWQSFYLLGMIRQRWQELNWGESININPQLNITAMPAHHRQGAHLQGNKTLWASYVIGGGWFLSFSFRWYRIQQSF